MSSSSSMSNWMVSMKVFLISSGVVSLAMAMKFTIPLIINFTVNELPSFWSVLASLFKPPYLYVVVNGIIITIAASSRFTHQSEPSPAYEPSQPLVSAETPPPIEICDALALAAPAVKEVNPPAAAAEEKVVVYEEKVFEVEKPVLQNTEEVVNNIEEEIVMPSSMFTSPQRIISQETITEKSEIATEVLSPVTAKPLVMSRFGHRRPLKATPEGGRMLRVARPKRQDTLESTWRMITEGRHVPLTRHLKKSDTFESHTHHPVNVTSPDENSSHAQNPHVRKSETFKDRTNRNDSAVSSSASLARIRKEPSLSQDELNRRVEAFIRKFNEEMRMQRQESLQQYKEMINRGA